MANVLVTGASRGIGRAIAVALAGRGDRIAVHFGSDRTAAEETAGLLAGAGHTVVGGSLSEPGAAEMIVEVAAEALGGIDILVNNAAIAPGKRHHHPIETVSDGERDVSRRRQIIAREAGAPRG
jgi:3-oxoacyl-[acyl-carrier protein] reductase